MRTCPSCAQENPEGARFCNACAAPLEAGARVQREERKVITVLFADLVGFTSRAERLDPEDVQAILSSYHERVRSELERFGGTVEKFIGDAVMAVFGAPVVREDDPERAVRAALAVRESIAELNEQDEARDLHVRIGVTTGEALVRLDARPEGGEGMAAGDVVNTAARLQTAAVTDGILVDETTYRATERAIQYRPGTAVIAKGKADPVTVYEAQHARSSFRVDVRPIGRTPLVGRERELETLVDALARARSEREPQLVTLVGVPGIGKSRLVYELFGRVEGDTELIAWRQGRCLPYGEGVSYWALAEMVKAQAGILETDSEADVAAKLKTAVVEVVPDEREADWLERNLRPLLGLEAEVQLSGDRRGEAFAAWRRFLEALADRRPLVLVFEDLHFADDGLLDFVDYLADWATGVPLLLLATARPELLARRAGWGGGKAHALTLSLSPLSDTDTAHLVHALLDQAVLDAEVQRKLLERAEGNPLYAEEFARLVAEGRQPDDLPETVQGIIAARIDGLASEEKALLQDAAVVGKVFWLGVVAALGASERWTLEERLHGLERKEFIRRERRSSVAAEDEYAFRHLLVRDVAYGQIPRAARADKHRRAAQWLERLGRPEDHAEMLAHHYLAALELSRAAGQDVAPLTEPARIALREAGDRAFALNAFPAAARYYGEAVSLAPEPDPELLFRRAEALFTFEDNAAESALEDARFALLAAGSSSRSAEADALLADVWWTRGERDRCFEHLSRAEELVRDAPPSAAKARVLSQVARFRALAGEVDEPIRIGLEALAIAEELGLDELRAHALNNVGIAKGNAGDMESAIADDERSIEIALSVNSPEAARGYNNLSAMLWYAGEFPRSHELREETMRIAERLGAVSIYRYARSNLPLYLHAAGRWDEAVRLADEIVVECERDPYMGEAYARRVRALIRLAREDRAGALDDAQRCLDVARRVKDPQTLLPALAVAVRVNFELGLGEVAVQTGAELVRELTLQPGSINIEWVPILGQTAAHVGIAEGISAALEPHRGNPWVDAGLAVVGERFSDAADRLRAIGDVASEADARRWAAGQLAAAGRRAEASAELDLAFAFYRSVGATRYIRQGEALLAATA